MSTRVPKHRKLARDHQVPTKTEFEIWCLMQAVAADRWCEAGLNREVGPTGVLGYWKYLRSGDLLVIEVEQ